MSAKNDSSKKPKHFQQIRRKRVGAVAVIEMEDVKSKLRYFRTECKRKNVTPRTKGHPTWEEAMLFASKQNIAVETGKIKETDDETIFKLKQLGEKINVSNIMKEEVPYGNITLDDVFNAGIQTLKSINRINNKREEAGLQRFSTHWALNDFEHYENKKSRVVKARVENP